MLSACHIARVDNRAADALSRNKLDVFYTQASRVACQVPAELAGVQRHWMTTDWMPWLIDGSLARSRYASGQRRYQSFCAQI